MRARRVRVLPLVVAAALALVGLAPLPAAADQVGPPVFGAATLTAYAGLADARTDEVDCPGGSVMTAVAVDLDPQDQVAAAGPRCAAAQRVGGQAKLGPPSGIVGWLADAPQNTEVRDVSACRAGWAVVGVRYTDASRTGIDSLGADCSELTPQGFLDDHFGDEESGDGDQVGADSSQTRDRISCPDGAVATAVSGFTDYSVLPGRLLRLRLRCQSLGFPSTAPEDVNVTWATALTVGADSTTHGDLDRPGQARWFRFPVQPGARVQVTLSDLPSDDDLVLFTDIEQAFTDLASTEDLTKLSAEFAGDAFAPSVFSPSVFSPSVFSPSVFSPSVFSPSVFSPSVFSPSVFSPSVFSPSVFSPSVFSPSVFSPGAFDPTASRTGQVSPSVFSPSVFSPSVFSDAYSSAQTRSVIGVSKHDGRAEESLGSATWNNTGYFYVRVDGRNGAYVPDQDFTLTVSTTSGVCDSGLDTFASTRTLSGAPGAQTVILTDPARMPGTAAQKVTLAAAVSAFAGTVGGAVVDLDQSPRVQALQQQADSARFVSCPYAKNLVAEAIRDIVNSYRPGGTLGYVVVVGDDSVVPFFRYPDAAGLGPESSYVPPMADDTASQASLRASYVLGQDAYGAVTDVQVKGTEVPVPDLAVGRLVESPVDMTAVLNHYVSRAGAPLRPSSSLATGYDFLTDNADAVAADFRAGIPEGTNDTLITDADVPRTTVTKNGTPTRRTSWTATDLRAALLGRRHDMVFLAGHFSGNNTLAADYSTTVNADEVSRGNFADALVFSGGCHSGYTIVDREGVPGVTVGLDWTEAFTRAGATLVAGTGYQYGDTDFLSYSERIYTDLARQLRYGTGPVPIGRALQQAKLTYLKTTPTLQGIDQKALLEATLYGLPMLGIDLPGGRLPVPGTASVAHPNPVGGAPGSVLGLQAADLSVSTAFGTVNQDLTNLDGGTVRAQYLTGPDGVSVNPGEPALPLSRSNVTVPGQVLRGIMLRSATYADADGITPLTGAPATETHGVHSPFVPPAFFPGRIASADYFDALGASGSAGTTSLLVTPAQHRSDGSGSLTTTQRRFSDLGLRLYYSANRTRYRAADGSENVPALSAPPGISGVSGVVDAATVTFRASVAGDPAAGIQLVSVLYTGERGSPLYGHWASLDLTQAEDDSTRWLADLALPDGQRPADVRFLVQAVNGVGAVSTDDNQGFYFTPGVTAGAPGADLPRTSLALASGNPSSGQYGDTVAVSATLNSAAAGADLSHKLVTFTLGAAARTVVTDSAGLARAQLPLSVTPGASDLVAAYGGDASTGPSSSAPATFTVRKQTTTLTLAATADQATATLTGLAGRPVREQPVYLAFVDASGAVLAARTVATDPDGRASAGLSGRPSGTTRVTASFARPDTLLPGGGKQDLTDPTYAASGPVGVTLASTVPLARPDSYTTVEGKTLTVAAPGVLANDSGATSVALAGGPASGQLTLRPDGSFRYTPTGDFVGTTTFTYTAKNGSQSATATVTITVTDAPAPSPCTIRGTAGDDVLTGTPQADVICGLGGNDVIHGGGGNDILVGGPGDDRIDGGDGHDLIIGGSGNDILDGGADSDAVDGRSGDDTVLGGAGDDGLIGGSGRDTVSGGPGNDLLIGGTGVDRLSGDDGADILDLRDGAGGDRGDGGGGTHDTAYRDPGDTVTAVP